METADAGVDCRGNDFLYAVIAFYILISRRVYLFPLLALLLAIINHTEKSARSSRSRYI